MVAAVRTNASEAELVALRQQADTELAPFRSKMSAVQRDQATIRARDMRIAALETDIASYRDQLKNVLARAVEKSRLLAEGKKRRRTPKPETLKPKIPKKRPRIPRAKRRAKRKPHGKHR